MTIKHVPKFMTREEKINDELLAATNEECIHWEHEHGICMECGEDIFDSLVGAAEAHFEGDR